LTIVLDDHSRIVLKNVDKDIPGSDYINANMIKVNMLMLYIFSNKEIVFKIIITLIFFQLDPFALAENYETRNYIVTQGCLHNSINDFWKMIWQEDSRVIVMITKLYEKSKVCVI